MENKASDFVKDDKHKNQLQLIEPNFIMGVGEVLTQGAKKYTPDNWKKAPYNEANDRYMGAMLRHMMSYKSGEEFDKESGLSHLHHIATNAMFLAWYDEVQRAKQKEKPILRIPQHLLDDAKRISKENHNISNPKKYIKHHGDNSEFKESIRKHIGSDREIDYVLFSSKNGAEEHVDTHLKHLDIFTWIIPIIVPRDAILIHSGGTTPLGVGKPVRINHQKPHQLIATEGEDCVLAMASEVL